MTSPESVSLFVPPLPLPIPTGAAVCLLCPLSRRGFFLAWGSSGLLSSVNYFILQIIKEIKIKQKSPVTFEITDYSECTAEYGVHTILFNTYLNSI